MAYPTLRGVPREEFGIWVVRQRVWSREYLAARGYPRPDWEPDTDTGFVYFVQAGGKRGPIKVGYTTRVKARLSALQSTNPKRLTLLATIAGSRDLERRLHNVFQDGRVHGEWFKPSTSGLRELVEWAETRLPV